MFDIFARLINCTYTYETVEYTRRFPSPVSTARSNKKNNVPNIGNLRFFLFYYYYSSGKTRNSFPSRMKT